MRYVQRHVLNTNRRRRPHKPPLKTPRQWPPKFIYQRHLPQPTFSEKPTPCRIFRGIAGRKPQSQWKTHYALGPPVVPFLTPFLGEGSPSKIDYRKSWHPSSNLSTGGPSAFWHLLALAGLGWIQCMDGSLAWLDLADCVGTRPVTGHLADERGWDPHFWRAFQEKLKGRRLICADLFERKSKRWGGVVESFRGDVIFTKRTLV